MRMRRDDYIEFLVIMAICTAMYCWFYTTKQAKAAQISVVVSELVK